MVPVTDSPSRLLVRRSPADGGSSGVAGSAAALAKRPSKLHLAGCVDDDRLSGPGAFHAATVAGASDGLAGSAARDNVGGDG